MTTRSSKIKLKPRSTWFGVALMLLVAPTIALGQCSDSTTTLWHNGNVVRSGSNQVWSWAQSYVTGDYADTWSVTVSATTAHNGGQTHSGQATASNGQIATVQWFDAPSSLGSGTYTEAEQHSFSNTCGGNQGPIYDNDSLTVNKPTISGFPQNGAFWYLGPGTPCQVAAQNGAYYIQCVPLTFNTNCGAGDTCTDTPQWTITSNNGQASLSARSGSSVTLTAGGTRGTCQYDSSVSASMGGFSTDANAVLVNSPRSLISAPGNQTIPWTQGINTGYMSQVYWNMGDACSPANALVGLPLYETFGVFANPGVTSGWPDPTPTSATAFNYDTYTFFDTIGASNASYVPVPLWTAYTPPFAFNTVIKWAPQSWFAGSTSQGSGLQVSAGTISYYVDHGTSVCTICQW
jgi:hypothetical protein